MSEDKTSAIVNDMRKMTLATGRVSSVQLNNLKAWGRLLFKNYEKINVEYSLDPNQYEEDENTGNMRLVPKENREFFVRYEIFKKEGSGDVYVAEESKVMDDLRSWVKYLFWDEVRVEVVIR